MTIEIDHLRDLLHYDPETGYFWWKVSRGAARKGGLAGSVRPDGYVTIKLGDRTYKAHRLAWFYVHEVWPKIVAHINGVRNDNRISNLTLSSMKELRASRISYRGDRGHLRTSIVPPEVSFGYPKEVTADYVRLVLDYDLNTGMFYRRHDGGGRRAGDVAETINPVTGYSTVLLTTGAGKKKYSAARLAWLYMYGSWPKHEIDHVNGIRSDNRIENLREATSSQNKLNRKDKPNKTGFVGVWRDKKKWSTRVKIMGQTVFSGSFDTAEEAYVAYMEARKQHYGEFMRAS